MKPAFAYAQRDLETVKSALPLVKDLGHCVQGGACLGVFPKYLASQFGIVHAFEPDPHLFRKAVMHANEVNIRWYNAAMGSRKERVRTRCERRDGTSRPVHEGLTHVIPDEHGTIVTWRIDDLALPSLGLLCIDVEGYEFEVIEGAQSTIEHFKPVIILEVNKQAQHGRARSEEALRNYVIKQGYEFKFRNHSDEVFVSCSR